MSKKTVLVTGANGYIGKAVAKAFRRAGWKTYGLIRRKEDANDLARCEIHPVIGSADDLSFLEQVDGLAFDVVVSNTEDYKNPVPHYERVRSMLKTIAGHSNEAGVRLLAMYTSGCKDYGEMSLKHGNPGLVAHTESDPMNPPAELRPRMEFGVSLLEAKDAPFDSVVLRPTIVYGNASSYQGELFKLAAGSEKVLKLHADPDTVMHSLDVDDCAEAYVMLAEHPKRAEVAQQAFNLSNAHYETAQQIGEALAKSYGLELEIVRPQEKVPFGILESLLNFSQWVCSDKVRQITGWKERKPTFIDGIEEYRLAYEAAKQL